MSIPVCTCSVVFDLQVSPSKMIKYCPLHKEAAEFFEILDNIAGSVEQKLHHEKCHCMHCRIIKSVYRARGLKVPETKEAT